MRRASTDVAWIGLALVVLGLMTSSWAILQLSDGLRELGRHWWSALATLPLLAGIGITAIGLVRASRLA